MAAGTSPFTTATKPPNGAAAAAAGTTTVPQLPEGPTQPPPPPPAANRTAAAPPSFPTAGGGTFGPDEGLPPFLAAARKNLFAIRKSFLSETIVCVELMEECWSRSCRFFSGVGRDRVDFSRTCTILPDQRRGRDLEMKIRKRSSLPWCSMLALPSGERNGIFNIFRLSPFTTLAWISASPRLSLPGAAGRVSV